MVLPIAAMIGAGSSVMESALGLGMDIWKQKMAKKAKEEEERREDQRRMMEEKFGAWQDFGPMQAGNFQNLSNAFTKTLLG